MPFLQNLLNFITSTLGITLVTVALAIGAGACMLRWMYWHTFFEMLGAAMLMMGIAAGGNWVQQIFG